MPLCKAATAIASTVNICFGTRKSEFLCLYLYSPTIFIDLMIHNNKSSSSTIRKLKIYSATMIDWIDQLFAVVQENGKTSNMKLQIHVQIFDVTFSDKFFERVIFCDS